MGEFDLPGSGTPGRRFGSHGPKDARWASTRASDTDREEVIAQLQEHYTEGRLDYDEWSVRMDQVASTKTWGELERVLDDLPELHQPQQPAVPRKERVRKIGLQERFGFSTAQLIIIAIVALVVLPIVLNILRGLAPILIIGFIIWLLMNRHRTRRF